jgi:hypothetical protein
VKRFEGFGGFILKLGAAIGLIATAGACAHGPKPEPAVQTVEVKVPVPVPCKAEVDVHDSYSDGLAEFTSDIWEQAVDLLTGRDERAADIERLKGAVTGCGGTVK